MTTARKLLPEAVASLVLGGLVFVRLLFAGGDSFSYDYANYMAYFRAIQETPVQDMLETLELTFPYVLVPGGGAFEFGFVAAAKLVLGFCDPTAAYALLAAASIGLRTFVMRYLGLGWLWIIPVQIYAITLFEANALRAGLALSITLVGLALFWRKRLAWGVVAFLLGASQHLQVSLFCLPFLALTVMPTRWLGKVWVAAMLAPALMVGTMLLTTMTAGVDISKLDDYSGQTSGAVGLNLISVLSLVFVLIALVLVILRLQALVGPPMGERVEDSFWLRVLLASLPALALLLFGTGLSAVGDRAWQFSLIILASLSAISLKDRKSRPLLSTALGVLFGVALVNILIRYPLSNFFAPPLPYEPIAPLWLVL